MDSLRNCISTQVTIRQESLDTIVYTFEPRELAKGDFLLKSGKVCLEMAFIESGYLRMYDLADGKEITLWIGSSGRFITSVSSFVFQKPAIWAIQAVTDCRLQVISRQKHFEL